MNKSGLILLSAGGTGGHMTPAVALAVDLRARGFRVEMITDQRGQKYAGLLADVPLHLVPSGALGGGVMKKLKGGLHLLHGMARAYWLLRRLGPAVVIGFGGYPSVPGVLAAQMLGIPTILHEQNAVIGKANAFLATRARRIALSWPLAAPLSGVEPDRFEITGNPVRPEIASLYHQAYPALHHSGPLRLFVVGGSLGANVFSYVVPQALSRLPLEYRKRLQVVQQCRAEDLETVRLAYETARIECRLAPFFTDVARELMDAHLVIARAGASTVAELTAAGRPAIFVPYPHHKDQQQKMNADFVADRGGAWVMTESGFTAEALLARLETFFQNPEILFRAAEKSRACGRPDAARRFGNMVTAIISGWPNAPQDASNS